MSVNRTIFRIDVTHDANAHKYGIILRYPLDKTAITGYIFEPWHYRYVGVRLATDIKKYNATLEDYTGLD